MLRSFALASVLMVTPLSAAPQDPGPVPEGISEDAVTEELVARGDELFNSGPCIKCHLEAGKGGPRAPALDDGEWLHGDGSFDAVREIIWRGVPRERLHDATRPFAMNPGGGLTDVDAAKLDALAAYILSLSR